MTTTKYSPTASQYSHRASHGIYSHQSEKLTMDLSIALALRNSGGTHIPSELEKFCARGNYCGRCQVKDCGRRT